MLLTGNEQKLPEYTYHGPQPTSLNESFPRNGSEDETSNEGQSETHYAIMLMNKPHQVDRQAYVLSGQKDKFDKRS